MMIEQQKEQQSYDAEQANAEKNNIVIVMMLNTHAQKEQHSYDAEHQKEQDSYDAEHACAEGTT